jgi:hypothetical protein
VFRVRPIEVRQIVAALGTRWTCVVERLHGAVYLRVSGPTADVVASMRRVAPDARRIDVDLLSDPSER